MTILVYDIIHWDGDLIRAEVNYEYVDIEQSFFRIKRKLIYAKLMHNAGTTYIQKSRHMLMT